VPIVSAVSYALSACNVATCSVDRQRKTVHRQIHQAVPGRGDVRTHLPGEQHPATAHQTALTHPRIDPEGTLAQAQWTKTRYGISTRTLPNGYCGLPLQRSCPHANACLKCPVFLTGPEFLPELQEQRRRTPTLIDVSECGGQARMVEMNQQVLTNLDRMISEVEKTVTKDTETTHAS
jgi:hypothetical protein